MFAAIVKAWYRFATQHSGLHTAADARLVLAVDAYVELEFKT